MDDEETLYKIVSTLSIITVYLPPSSTILSSYRERERERYLESLISLMIFISIIRATIVNLNF